MLNKGYKVYGLSRRENPSESDNLAHIKNEIHFINGDITNQESVALALKQSRPDEVYNLAAQSFVAGSWEAPQVSAQTNTLGVVNILEAIRGTKPDTRFYQASSSEMFGQGLETPQNENTPFKPCSPYGISKLYAHLMTANYREAYGLFTCCGILYNHESERRGYEYVTRKITAAAASIAKGKQTCLELGNLSASRDWGYAGDYVAAMHLMLRHHTPDDYVVATGQTHTVREFAAKAFAAAGINLRFEGEGLAEVGIENRTGETRLRVNPVFFRPVEVGMLVGDPQKVTQVLGWKRNVSFDALIERMVKNDIEIIEKG